ncbi:Cloroperoxidase [Polychaeton citri CBS 116435]|uniref:Cloroperoxidase n=1 Tax=Polychaeton citri CBS 116435 TaxID=1314669 RepID=A0A9P4Q996_9PEZI|nr:Cloroperoxidase [Polychaeton citri CBS 116435]
MKNIAALSLLAASASAFPWVVDQAGVDSSLLPKHRRSWKRQQSGGGNAGGPATCPFNANHVPAAPVTSQFPYNNAKDGKQGNGKGGYQVPAPGDTAHTYKAPTANDIRGPCPGLNVAANYNFLSRDGITTFNELVDAQQNVYNVGYDLAQLLAVLGLTLTDGDLVTEKLSIGCDATTRTSVNPALTGSEPGLDGHNKFEADSSLTRNDFFTHGGDNFSFNRTLFNMMDTTCKSNFDINGLSLYRQQRWAQSQAENPNFFFGPLTLLLYGAASFLYELMPSGSHNYAPDYDTIYSFFVKEQLPANWINRVAPYTNNDVTREILKMYLLNPVLFGGNTADGSFDALNFGAIKNGKISPSITPAETSCLLYQLTTGQIPSYLNGVITPTVDALAFALTKLSPSFKNLGCPIPLT